MAKVLITGGAGFIGSYITRELLAGGHEPVLYDSFVQYISPLKSQYQAFLDERFKDTKDKIIVVRGDTRDKDDLRRCVMKHRPHRIIHLAAMPIADLSNLHSEEALSSIINGTVNLLEIIRDVDFVKRITYASSSMVYGDFKYLPADEEHPRNPKDVYGGTKCAGEILVQSFARRYGIEYSIVRPSAVYGPTDVNNRVSQLFIEKALSGTPLILHGGGTASLDFTFVEDTAHGFVLAAFHDNAKNEIFNITRGEGRTLMEYVEILKKHVPNLSTEAGETDVFRPKRGSMSIEKARRLLGYQPKYSLEDGIAKYHEFLTRKKTA